MGSSAPSISMERRIGEALSKPCLLIHRLMEIDVAVSSTAIAVLSKRRSGCNAEGGPRKGRKVN